MGLLFFSACAPRELSNPYSEWQFTDVKVLDDEGVPDTDELPSADLLALYLRESEQELQLRLDFFELPAITDFDLYLAFEVVAGGVELSSPPKDGFAWDTLVKISASGLIEVQNSFGRPLQQARIQVFRDPILDHLLLSMSKDILPAGPPGFQVFAWITHPNSEKVLDHLPLAYSEARPPQPVNILMAFSDTFPAYTPAQALRRWDGAHTGPSGGRHGLNNLLRTTSNFQIPVVLLDLLNPASLSALEYMGNLEVIRDLIVNGMVIAPQYAPALACTDEILPTSQVLETLNSVNQEMISTYNLRQPFILYAPSGFIPMGSSAKLIFVPSTNDQNLDRNVNTEQPQRWQDRVVLSLADHSLQPQASSNGPSGELKQSLVNVMLANQIEKPKGMSNLVVLGGSLPSSTWGDPQAARPTLRYLKSRPWLHFLNENDLLTLQGEPSEHERTPNISENGTSPGYSELWQAIDHAPNNSLSLAARQAFLAAANPVYPQTGELAQLRAIYLKQTWVLLSASQWGENPFTTTNCEVDFDLDGKNECLLTNNHLYALLQPESGMLSYLFYRSTHSTHNLPELHQLIGPSAQLISGLSESNTWDLEASIYADPAVIPGAFDQPGKQYNTQLLEGALSFISPDGSQKTYNLTEDSLQIHYHVPASAEIKSQKLPLMPDPWLRFELGWWKNYHLDKYEDKLRLRWAPDLEVLIAANFPLQADSFLDSQSWMALTENPNREQPNGHFLPFPLFLLEIPAVNDFDLMIQFFNTEEAILKDTSDLSGK